MRGPEWRGYGVRGLGSSGVALRLIAAVVGLRGWRRVRECSDLAATVSRRLRECSL